MKQITLLTFSFLFTNVTITAPTTLTHNNGDDILGLSIYSYCGGSVNWGRKFILSNF